mgnify:CR=1 FL=1
MLDAQDQFYPQRKITKVEMLVGLLRSLQINNSIEPVDLSEVTLKFKDVSPTHWALNDIKLAVYLGLISDGPYFYPKKLINRAECAAILIRVPNVRHKVSTALKSYVTPTD